MSNPKFAWAFSPTTGAITTDWLEVVDRNDPRPLPAVAAVCAVSADGTPLPFYTSTCIEVELPGMAPVPLDFAGILSIQKIDFQCRWRFVKPETVEPMTLAVWGYDPAIFVNR
jgi:hypothetical protein